mgnify:CR=1 FL=1
MCGFLAYRTPLTSTLSITLRISSSSSEDSSILPASIACLTRSGLVCERGERRGGGCASAKEGRASARRSAAQG